MSCLNVVYFILIIVFLVNVNGNDFCGERRNFDGPKGIIETNDDAERFKNCSWYIKTPKRSVIYIKIQNLQLGTNMNMNFGMERNCLLIRSMDTEWTFFNLCSETLNFEALSIPTNKLIIDLEITSESYLELTYTSYIVNCTYDKLVCTTSTSRSFPRNPNDNCLRGMLTCDPSCGKRAAGCGDGCYDIFLQRCDGIINCPNAEDEVGCNPAVCPNGIKCSNDTKCVKPKQICDSNMDCKDGSDEADCPKSYCKGHEPGCYVEKNIAGELEQADESIYVIVIVLGCLAIFFLCVVFRCLASRQNVRLLLNRPLDIPLPPFRGPGEGTSTVEMNPFTDEDFQPGGEIYEGFTKNIEKIKSKRKNILELEEGGITFVKPPPREEALNKYFHGVKPVISEELAALATLKLSRDMCYGLRKTKSEERAMTKVLFVDHVDDGVSDDSETEGTTNWKKDLRRNKNIYPKSETDYVRRKRVEITIV